MGKTRLQRKFYDCKQKKCLRGKQLLSLLVYTLKPRGESMQSVRTRARAIIYARTHAQNMYINSKIVKCTLQNEEKMHFFIKIFAYVKKKQYLCSVKLKKHNQKCFTYSRL